MERRTAFAVLGVLLLALVAQLRYGAATDGVTIDELVYVHAGYRHLYDGDFRLNPEQPPLAKQWAAMGFLGMPLRIDPPPATPEDEWRSAFQFLHVDNVHLPVLLRARTWHFAWAVLLVGLVALWAGEVLGPKGAVIAASLLVFHPSLLAHGHLVTTDVPAAFFMVLTSWVFWRWLRDPSVLWALAVAASLGFGLGARLTMVLQVIVFAVLWAAQAGRGHIKRPGLKPALLLVLAAAAVAPFIVWGLYGFRYAPWPGASVAQPIGAHLGAAGRLVGCFEAHRLLPEAYLEGARFILEHNASGHQTFLLGELSTEGWPHYYLVALLAKSPLAFLALCAVGVGLLVWYRSPSVPLRHWGLPIVILLGAMSMGRIQIGERYVLAVYPYLALLAAAGLVKVVERPRGKLMIGALVAAQAAAALFAAPNGYLTFFNRVAGGRLEGHRVLIDSNLDWGQDLPRLSAWLKKERVERVSLAYHGCDDPDRYGFMHDDLPGAHLYSSNGTNELHGVVAVSANMLVGLFDPPGNPRYRALQNRMPDARAGSMFIYRLGEPGLGRLPY